MRRTKAQRWTLYVGEYPRRSSEFHAAVKGAKAEHSGEKRRAEFYIRRNSTTSGRKRRCVSRGGPS